MNNQTVGKISALVTGTAVLAFSVSMIFGLFTNTLFFSCFASMFIAMGYVGFATSLYACNQNPGRKAAGLCGVAFAAVYAVLILIVYYAECTTVRMNPALGEGSLSIISYSHLGSLFFNYNLLGYGFMGLSTFLLSFTVHTESTSGGALRLLLRGHGVFFFPCLVVPMLPIFSPGTSDLVGTVLLEAWCAYFLPVCILGYRWFKNNRDKQKAG